MEKNPQVLCRVTGPIAVENVRTRNGTIYSSKLWDAVESSPEFKEMMDNKSFYIGLDHPESTERDSLCSRLREVAGIVSSWVRQPNGVINVIIDVLDTPYGRIVNTLARYGSFIGLSTRAEGDTEPDGNVTPSTYDLFGADFVTVPSQFASRMKLVLEEGKFRQTKISRRDLIEAYNYVKDNRSCRKVAQQLRSLISKEGIMENRVSRRLVERKLRAKGYALIEGGFIRNLATGEDSKILQESRTKSGKSYVLRGGHEVNISLVEGTKRSRRGRRVEEFAPTSGYDDIEELDDPLLEDEEYDEFGNPLNEGDEEYDEFGNPLNEGDEEYIDDEDEEFLEGVTVGGSRGVSSGPRYSGSKNKMLARKLEKCLESELEDGEFISDEEKDVVLVEGRHCSVRISGSVLTVTNRRGLRERFLVEKGDSLVECVRKVRRMYNR